MGKSYAQLWRDGWTIADRKERNRRTLRPETYRGAYADLCIAIDNSRERSADYNPRYWGMRWEWHSNEVKRFLDDLIRKGVLVKRKKQHKRGHWISAPDTHCDQNVTGLYSDCGQESQERQETDSLIVTGLCRNGDQFVSKVPPTNYPVFGSECAAHADADEKFVYARCGARMKKLTGLKLVWFKDFWETFNHREGRAEAAWAWLDIPDIDEPLVYQKIIPAAEAEAKRRTAIEAAGRTPRMAQGWINGRRWEDEFPVPAEQSQRPGRREQLEEEIEDYTKILRREDPPGLANKYFVKGESFQFFLQRIEEQRERAQKKLTNWGTFA